MSIRSFLLLSHEAKGSQTPSGAAGLQAGAPFGAGWCGGAGSWLGIGLLSHRLPNPSASYRNIHQEPWGESGWAGRCPQPSASLLRSRPPPAAPHSRGEGGLGPSLRAVWQQHRPARGRGRAPRGQGSSRPGLGNLLLVQPQLERGCQQCSHPQGSTIKRGRMHRVLKIFFFLLLFFTCFIRKKKKKSP